GRFTKFPRLNVITLERQLERLGEKWDDEAYVDSLKTYAGTFRRRAFLRIIRMIIGVLFVVQFYFQFLHGKGANPELTSADILPIVKFLLGVLVIFGPGYALGRFSVMLAYSRFYRLIGIVLNRLRAHEI